MSMKIVLESGEKLKEKLLSPKSAASAAIGLCNCDPHIETCDQCAPYLAGKGEPVTNQRRRAQRARDPKE